MNNEKDYAKSIIEFFVTLFLGYFGIHKFIKKDYKMGFVYLFTMGLFGFGWLIDCCISAYKMITTYYANNKVSANMSTSENNNISTSSFIRNDNVNITNNNANINFVKKRIDYEIIESVKTKFIAFDTETTGLNPQYDRIVELGAVVFENGKCVKKYQSLVNAGIKIPLAASEVNHITNEMLSTANTEDFVYPEFTKFIEEALNGDVIICAHNADFDMNFLKTTFRRLGISANIKYIDTLEISRACLYSVDNHKQGTIADYFGIQNNNSHRADSDAEVCGNILINLIPLIEEKIEKEQIHKEKCKMNEIESIISCGFQQLIQDNFDDTDVLSFSKNTSGYITMLYFYSVIKYKCTSKGNYIIIPKKISKKLNLKSEDCSTAEDNINNVRIYFQKVSDLSDVYPFIFQEYKKAIKYTEDYANNSEYCRKKVISTYNDNIVFTDAQKDEYKKRALEIQEQKRIEFEKQEQLAIEKENQKRLKEEAKQRIKEEKEKRRNEPIEGRKVIQLDDSGNVINKFISISEAVRVTGVNSKSIRDAANGIQKHAGGYVWKYDDKDME